MNSIKPLITIAVLGAIGYFVYTHLNSKPPTPPPGAPANWNSEPLVQLPGEESTAPNWSGSGNTSGPAGILPQTGFGTSAPPASAPSGTLSDAPSFPGSSSSAPTTTNTATELAPEYTARANYGDTPAAADPSAEKWGTTDPSAAVSSTPPPNIRFGEPPESANAATSNAAGITTGLGPEHGTGSGVAGAYGADASHMPDVSSADAGKRFQAALESGTRLLEEGKLAEGLVELSAWHEHPELSATERQHLTSLLDQVAGTVIYSTQHYVLPPHVVKENETLEQIGEFYQVPWQLIAKINGVDDPTSLRPGEELKVVRGPFSAVIHLQKRQLTLMVNNMYAGRFILGLGRDMPLREGTFAVTEKRMNPVYHGQGRTIAADDPNNPLGEFWIGIDRDMAIHGIGPLAEIGSTNQPGSAGLSKRDIEDVYDILTVGSKVLILR